MFYKVRTEVTTSHKNQKVLLNLAHVRMVYRTSKHVEVAMGDSWNETFRFEREDDAKIMFSRIWNRENG